MPSDRYYDEIDEAEDRRYYKRRRELIERTNKMTLDEKIDLLLRDYIDRKTSK